MTIRRRGFGSGHAYYVDGMMGEPTKLAGMEGLVKAPGVTSILRMMPKDALSQWYSRTAADYAVNHWAELSELPLMGKGGRHAAIMNAPNEDRDAAAGKGTKVHGYAARLALGEPLRSLDIPDELVGHVRAYAAWLRRYQVETIAAELVVINRAVGYCGSVDLIAELRDQVWLLELKTSRSGIFRESALQATGYEHAESYVHPPEWDNEHPVKELAIDRCGSVWIRSDGVDLRALDTGPDVWAYFQRLALNYQAEDDSRTWVGELIE